MEFSLIAPVIFLVTFGATDFFIGTWQYSAALKSAQFGARRAAISNPVAPDLFTGLFSSAVDLGIACTNQTSGVANGDCSFTAVTCTSPDNGSGSCTNGKTFNLANFDYIYNRMKKAYPSLLRSNVSIKYEQSGLGFVGRPNGIPVNITVTLKCMTFDFPFLRLLARWVGPNAETGCPVTTPKRWPIQNVRVTLPSEDLNSANNGLGVNGP